MGNAGSRPSDSSLPSVGSNEVMIISDIDKSMISASQATKQIVVNERQQHQQTVELQKALVEKACNSQEMLNSGSKQIDLLTVKQEVKEWASKFDFKVDCPVEGINPCVVRRIIR